MATEEKFVLGLDVGTTTIRAFVFDQNGSLRGSSTDKVVLLNPHPGWVEIAPDTLWNSIVKVMKTALEDTGIEAKQLQSIGISTQRATFINWSKSTGVPFHNFVTWKDLRAGDLVKEWDKGFSMKGVRYGSKLLHLLTRQKKFMIGSIMKLQNKMVNLRLLWTLLHIEKLKGALANEEEKDDVLFGTLDSWLIFKFSGEKKLHMSNISNAAATGLYDPFGLEWAPWAFGLFGIPTHIMPEVVDDAGDHFGVTASDILGSEVPMSAVMADQSASMFGLGCFQQGQIKMSLGTGSFLDVNTGRDVHASMKGLVPLVGWRIGDDLAYLAEGANHDTSSVILWAKDMGLFQDPKDSSDIAKSAQTDSDLYFIPAFGGLQAPVNDPKAGAGFIGLTPNDGPKEMLRAVLESIAFGMKQLLDIMESESQYSLGCDTIEIDGGVSNNDFIVQLISTLTGKNISRGSSVESSVFGVAFVSGLHSGIWSSKDDLKRLRNIERVFKPDSEGRDKLLDKYNRWVQACQRFKHWDQS